MLDTYKDLTIRQFQAALCTLNACITRCPDAAWNAPVAGLKFCQAAFHVLFFTDFYLGDDERAFKTQPFHQDRPDFFRDYEEFAHRQQTLLYDKPTTQAYLQHCRTKAEQTIPAESAEVLAASSKLRPQLTRAELHVYNLRHIQHHAAQLSLRLRLDHRVDIPWIGYGWREL
jgi:hypothetical protein